MLSHLIASGLPSVHVQVPFTTGSVAEPASWGSTARQFSTRDFVSTLQAVEALNTPLTSEGNCVRPRKSAGPVNPGAPQMEATSIGIPFLASVASLESHGVSRHKTDSDPGNNLPVSPREKSSTPQATPTASLPDPSATASAAWIGTPLAISLTSPSPTNSVPAERFPKASEADSASTSALLRPHITQLPATDPIGAASLKPGDKVKAVEVSQTNSFVNGRTLPQTEVIAPSQLVDSRTMTATAPIQVPQDTDPSIARLGAFFPTTPTPIAAASASESQSHPQRAHNLSIPIPPDMTVALVSPDPKAQSACPLEPVIPILRSRTASSRSMTHDSVTHYLVNVDRNQGSGLLSSPALPSPVNANVHPPEAPAAAVNGPHPAVDPFTSLDTGSAVPAQWTSVGTHRAEAGFLDPSLGWIGVRADAAGTAFHATVLPVTSEAAQVLATHLGGLQSYLAENHASAASLTLADPGMSFTAQADSGSQQGPSHEANSHPQPTIADFTPLAARSLPTTLPPTVIAAPAGATISVVA